MMKPLFHLLSAALLAACAPGEPAARNVREPAAPVRSEEAAARSLRPESGYATPGKSEAWYRDRIAEAMDGETEVTVEDGRVDIVTESHAIEVERASSWKEAPGQALWYAHETGKRAGVVVIVQDAGDAEDAARLEELVAAYGLPVRVWNWPLRGSAE